ncbi:23S rRNA pseudouridine(2605) synthase RluB [Litorivicinus lipolyticus]|nr:pseudouridine synthase [Litorivicinus lipolyticus]
MKERIHKVLARAGVGSRRGIEQLIKENRVKVNGKAATIGDSLERGDTVRIDGKPVKVETAFTQFRRVIAYHKPEGEVCTASDPEGRPTVFDRLPDPGQGRWIMVGRLDVNTCGLLLFTTDGDLAHKLMHPSSQVDREYAVRVRGHVGDEMINRLKTGVELEDGPAKFTDIQPSLEDGDGQNHWYYCVLMEGRHREARRLWDSQGVTVSRLRRVRYGCIFLPKRLRSGRWEELDQRSCNDLADSVGVERAAVPQKTPDQLIKERRVSKKRVRIKR